MKKVVIAIDSYKGCMTSFEANKAVAEVIHRHYPETKIDLFNVSDGGEGFIEALYDSHKYSIHSVEVHDALFQKRDVEYALSHCNKSALIELSRICGLSDLPESKRNPSQTSSYGLGEVLLEVARKGCREIVVGLGGSSTNDAGVGALEAMGCHFYNNEGKLLTFIKGGELGDIAKVDASAIDNVLTSCSITFVTDVSNELYGVNGAAHVFAPQKGADAAMVQLLDEGLLHFSSLLLDQYKCDVAHFSGAGAAGGIAAGISAFLKTTVLGGVDYVLSALNFEAHLADADLVITGEGHADAQTAMGKLPFGVLRQAQKFHLPVVLLAGGVDDALALNKLGFSAVFSIQQDVISLNRAKAKSVAIAHLKSTSLQVLRLFSVGR